MCKLNELPNNEEKYNKILSYFNTDLDSLDWGKLIKQEWKLSNDSKSYKERFFEYAATTNKKKNKLSHKCNRFIFKQ